MSESAVLSCSFYASVNQKEPLTAGKLHVKAPDFADKTGAWLSSDHQSQ